MVYSTKYKFICPICCKVKLWCESYPHYDVRICEECHDVLLKKREENLWENQKDVVKK